MKNVDESSTRPEKKDIDIFNSIDAKLLWVSKRGRPKIETAILFLCTKSTKSTKEDKAKYLKHTIDDKTIMVADSLIQLCTWVYAAYGVHFDLKSHIGGCMHFGYGMVHCKSRKEKINKKSSTEADR